MAVPVHTTRDDKGHLHLHIISGKQRVAEDCLLVTRGVCVWGHQEMEEGCLSVCLGRDLFSHEGAYSGLRSGPVLKGTLLF